MLYVLTVTNLEDVECDTVCGVYDNIDTAEQGAMTLFEDMRDNGTRTNLGDIEYNVFEVELNGPLSALDYRVPMSFSTHKRGRRNRSEDTLTMFRRTREDVARLSYLT